MFPMAMANVKNAIYEESANYIWDQKEELGHGATCYVYLGYHKITGESCAVKVLRSQDLNQRAKESLNREISALKLVNPYTVHLLAVEKSLRTNVTVIITDLCSSGSLYDVLLKPENACGLEDEEYLLLLRSLREGISHMRQHNLIHRDIKPGNIMRHVTHTGVSMYKLSDFGASRFLPEGEQFESIVGTEEYLHPGIYEQAFFLRHDKKAHSAEVDLWSLGVTLYQAATGDFPFRVYNYNRNTESRNKLHRMNTRHEAGVISGVEGADGTVTWSRTLPSSSAISPHLGDLVTPLLASLLEHRPEKTWNFDQFIQAVDDILSHIVFDIFQPRNSDLRKIYLKNPTVSSIESYVVSIWGIENVLLFREGQLINKEDDGDKSVNSGTILVGARRAYSVPLVTNDECLRDAKLVYGSDKRTANVKSKQKLCIIRKKCQQLDSKYELYQGFVEAFHAYIQDEVRQTYHQMKGWINAVEATTRFAEKAVRLNIETDESVDKKLKNIHEIKRSAAEGKKCGDQYYAKIVATSEILKRWNATPIEEPGLKVDMAVLIQYTNEAYKTSVQQHIPAIAVTVFRNRAETLFNQVIFNLKKREDQLEEIRKRFADWEKTSHSVFLKIIKLVEFWDTLEKRRASLLDSATKWMEGRQSQDDRSVFPYGGDGRRNTIDGCPSQIFTESSLSQQMSQSESTEYSEHGTFVSDTNTEDMRLITQLYYDVLNINENIESNIKRKTSNRF